MNKLRKNVTIQSDLIEYIGTLLNVMYWFPLQYTVNIILINNITINTLNVIRKLNWVHNKTMGPKGDSVLALGDKLNV